MDVDAPTESDNQAEPKGRKARSGAADEFIEIIKTIFYALLIALVLRVLLFQPFTIPSSSMVPNLLVGDYIIVTKYSYGYSRHSIPLSPPIFEGRILGREPERGDIAVFKDTKDNRTDYIKRVIGLPGDRIQMRQGVVYLNDQPLPQEQLEVVANGYQVATLLREALPNGETYIVQDTGETAPDHTMVFVVPEDHYFMMGDNRDNSSDSRVERALGGVEFVPEENLVGKAQIILFSWHEGASLLKPWTWFTKARPSRFFHGLD